jgi:hypothetical protein
MFCSVFFVLEHFLMILLDVFVPAMVITFDYCRCVIFLYNQYYYMDLLIGTKWF